MTIRVLAGLDTEAVIAQLRRSLADPDVESVVIHKPGSHLHLSDGKEAVVTAAGNLVAVLSATADGRSC